MLCMQVCMFLCLPDNTLDFKSAPGRVAATHSHCWLCSILYIYKYVCMYIFSHTFPADWRCCVPLFPPFVDVALHGSEWECGCGCGCGCFCCCCWCCCCWSTWARCSCCGSPVLRCFSSVDCLKCKFVLIIPWQASTAAASVLAVIVSVAVTHWHPTESNPTNPYRSHNLQRTVEYLADMDISVGGDNDIYLSPKANFNTSSLCL